jgi:hypothetical protein
LNTPSPSEILITDSAGNTVSIPGEDIQNAVIALNRDQVTLIFPDRGRSAWLTDIVEIESH